MRKGWKKESRLIITEIWLFIETQLRIVKKKSVCYLNQHWGLNPSLLSLDKTNSGSRFNNSVSHILRNYFVLNPSFWILLCCIILFQSFTCLFRLLFICMCVVYIVSNYIFIDAFCFWCQLTFCHVYFILLRFEYSSFSALFFLKKITR